MAADGAVHSQDAVLVGRDRGVHDRVVGDRRKGVPRVNDRDRC